MAAPDAQEIETKILSRVNADGCIADSGEFAQALGVDHNVVVGVLKSLEAYEMIATEVSSIKSAVPSARICVPNPPFSLLRLPSPLQDIKHSRYNLTEEARGYLGPGTPEFQLFSAVPPAGAPLAELKSKLGPLADLGFKQAMQLKWVAIDKSTGEPMVVRKVDDAQDNVHALLTALSNGGDTSASAAELQALVKRKMLVLQSWKTFKVVKGPKFALERKKPATDLTSEMLLKGTWREQEFKEYNFAALGLAPTGGHLHPLLKVRTQFRKIFTNMGFEEMPTNNYVESSFWNFDALFQPQQHPARDAHDTFFLTGENVRWSHQLHFRFSTECYMNKRDSRQSIYACMALPLRKLSCVQVACNFNVWFVGGPCSAGCHARLHRPPRLP